MKSKVNVLYMLHHKAEEERLKEKEVPGQYNRSMIQILLSLMRKENRIL